MASLLFLVLLVCATARKITIDNTKPLLDINGKIVDANDGSIQQFPVLKDGLYYRHAVQCTFSCALCVSTRLQTVCAKSPIVTAAT